MATLPTSQELSHVTDSFILKIEAICSSVTAVAIYQTTRHQIAQANNYTFFFFVVLELFPNIRFVT
jgi:hypothetical protein